MILLSANNTVNLPSIIGAIIILAVIVFAIWYRFKTHPSKGDKAAAENFLNGLADNVYARITRIINETNLDKYKDIQSLEADVLKKIYDSIFEYIEGELKKASEDDILSALALKALDKDTIYKFIDKIINDKEVVSTIDNVYGAHEIAKSSNKLTEEDKKLEEEYSDQDQYIEELNNDELPKAEPEVHTKEETEVLNPPRDDEEEYNPDDSSMELLDDDVYIDASGRKRSKSTGRYVKTKK